MKLATYIPCDILKPYIQSFIVNENPVETTYTVLPGTSLVIGFQYKGGLKHITPNQETQLSTAGISGISDHYKVFKNTPNIGTVLVIFKEAGASVFFKQPLHELFRESVSLDNFMLRSELLVIEEQLNKAKTDTERVKVIEQFLISLMRETEPDSLALAALSLIHQSQGNIRITELAAHLHTSQSPLEKRFRAAVGTTPKKFASIVRLKHAIQNHQPNNPLSTIGYNAGFYDQAHFIKEFKVFTGQTPESFFGKG